MKIFRSEEYLKVKNQTPDRSYRPEILTADDQAKNLGGLFGLFPPGTQVPYHYHKNRESLIVVISGEGIEVIEGEETPIKAGDVLYIPAGEKHTTINRSNQDLRFFEFSTCSFLAADFVKVE
jgi:mannose-6-phosphate isomerase-like protein (cupin superfamily)